MGDRRGPGRRDSDPNVSLRERTIWTSEGATVLSKPGNAGGGRGPCLRHACNGVEGRKGLAMSLKTPEKIGTLQRKLYAKAHTCSRWAEPDYRFYLRLTTRSTGSTSSRTLMPGQRPTMGQSCWKHAFGMTVDGVGFATIEAAGLEEWLEKLAQELRDRTYRPQAERRVLIPKRHVEDMPPAWSGDERPLGIPVPGLIRPGH